MRISEKMEMSIDEAMINLYAMKDYYNNDKLDSHAGFDRKDNESIDLAIETIRKYQKIQEIINNTDYIEEDVIRYKMICEVIKDET